MRKLFVLFAANLLACTPAPEKQDFRTCSPSVELVSDAGWRTTVCPADSTSAWAVALSAEGVYDRDDLGYEIDWCVYDDAGSPTCGTTYIPPHPWCSGDDEDPSPCPDIACCMLTIINAGCGGCLEPSGGDESGE